MDAYKILYQGVPSGADTALYSVPARGAQQYTIAGDAADIIPSVVDQNIQTIITQLIFCDAVGTSDTIDVHLTEASDTAAAAANMIFHALSVGANATERIKVNWPLSGGNTIRVVPTAGSIVTITVLGIEVK